MPHPSDTRLASRDAFLAAVAAAVARAWELWRTSPPVDCQLCGDTRYLDAPVGSWRPFCPRFLCAYKRSYARPPWG